MEQQNSRAVQAFLDQITSKPAGMLVKGEAGIGKTTRLLSVAEQAAARNFRVLSTVGAAAEARFPFAAAADLLATVEPSVFADLPTVQQAALARVLLLDGDDPPDDERLVATAILSVVQSLGRVAPVLIIVDDAQWLDESSRAVLGYVVRRATGRIGVAASVRTGEPSHDKSVSWLQFSDPEAVSTLSVEPLTLGGLHAAISRRLGRTLSRPWITRIHDISRGNPFIALELARVADAAPARTANDLPDSLAVLVGQRIGKPDPELHAVLLAAASAVGSTVEHVSRATELTVDRVVEIIEAAADSGVITLDGNTVQFCHPVFARGVYSAAGPAQRRAMHRRFVTIVEEPEQRARHMALSASTADPVTLEALDEAAQAAQYEGASAVAAELLDFAIALGGGTPQRRLRAAELHYRSGALDPAHQHLQPVIDDPAIDSSLRCVALMLSAAVTGLRENIHSAVEALTQAIAITDDPVLRLRARLFLIPALSIAGRVEACIENARITVADAERVNVDDLRSQALAILVFVRFRHGLGFDRHQLQQALQLENPNSAASAPFRASAVQAVTTGWAGELDTAREHVHRAQRQLLRAGAELDAIWIANEAAMIDIWLGRYDDATRHVEDGIQRAEQMSHSHLMVALRASQAAIAAYRGNVHEARAAARRAIDDARASGSIRQIMLPTAVLGFVELSLGDVAAALRELEPLISAFDPARDIEIVSGPFLPDAIEALTSVGRVEEAEFLVTALHDAAAQRDRPWMWAIGARGRAHVDAARGNLDAAEHALQEAMNHHRRLPMPFETARTQLLFGQVQRRYRRRHAASETLRGALAAFERLGAPLWARRAECELRHLTTPLGGGSGLTAAERRIAERAAAGLSNKQIAAELFVAPKTVESNLSSAYRKLGIRSRSGLFAALLPADSQQNS